MSHSLVELEIASVVCSAVAITTTLFRLLVRRGRYWWDDACACFSMVCLFMQVAAVFMHTAKPGSLSQFNKVAAYYLLATTFYVIIWSARLAILLSIIRISPNDMQRRRLFYFVGPFVVTALVMLGQLFWVCEPAPAWKQLAAPQCPLTTQVVICQLVSDVLADTLLLAAPLRILVELRDAGLRRRLMLIFSTSVATTLVSLVHAVYILQRGTTKVIIAAIVEDSGSLIVCNVPVVVAAAIARFGRRDAERPATDMHFRTGGKSMRSVQLSGTSVTLDPVDVQSLSFGVKQDTAISAYAVELQRLNATANLGLYMNSSRTPMEV